LTWFSIARAGTSKALVTRARNGLLHARVSSGKVRLTPPVGCQRQAAMPEFHFGHFDVRFEDFAEVQRGAGFTILEVHGAGAESTHIRERRTGLLRAWRALTPQYPATD
jgi:hypothetical protein